MRRFRTEKRLLQFLVVQVSDVVDAPIAADNDVLRGDPEIEGSA